VRHLVSVLCLLALAAPGVALAQPMLPVVTATAEAQPTTATLVPVALTPSATPAPAAAAGPKDVRVALLEDHVTLGLDEVSIPEVMKLLSQTSRVNIISGPDVTGNVSVNLYHVTLADALDAILGMGGFTYYVKNNVIYVTAEKRQLEIPSFANDLEIRTFTISHAVPEDLLDTVNEFLSPSGKATLGKENQIVVRDSPGYLASIARLISEVDAPPRQVLITAKLLTVQYDDDMTLGVGFERNKALEDTPIITKGFAENPTQLATGALGLFAGHANKDLNVFLQALEEKGDVNILAAPQLLVLDGEEAQIQVGDRLGFRLKTVTETAALETIEFLELGTVLSVTPKIGEDGLIRLNINPKVSNGRISADGLPSENTAEAKTSMIVADHQTIMIGGLINLGKRRLRTQIPVLGSIPYLGYFFGRTRSVENKQELIILIQPEIIAPQSPTPQMQDRTQVVEHWQADMLDNDNLGRWPANFRNRAGRVDGQAPRSNVLDPVQPDPAPAEARP
jgi:type II secretory pathway component GspD/PulD (secretin)